MYDLSRFLKAQENTYKTALLEIKMGRKRGHWMWYIFPQIQGLGFSSTSQYYAIKNLEEGKEYLSHPVLGTRLVEISEALVGLEDTDPRLVMGYPDNLKLRSCMTLFEIAAPDQPVFRNVLDKFYGGKLDEQTVEILKKEFDYDIHI